MVADIRTLPLVSLEAFKADPHTEAAAESYLRRGLEALFDLCRHLLAKGFGRAPVEYKGIAQALGQVEVLTPQEVRLMTLMAGYRNRMVHFYDEIQTDELYDVCANHIQDIERITGAIERWLQTHPERIDGSF
jgi:uncharacterized protein YutE (UPF0331/DUF86 family)